MHYLNSLELKIAFDDWEIIHYPEIQRLAHLPDQGGQETMDRPIGGSQTIDLKGNKYEIFNP